MPNSLPTWTSLTKWESQVRHYRRHIMVPAILLFFFLAVNSMVGDSPTIDEQNHIARGLALLYSGDPHFSLEHPPFQNLLSALMVSTAKEIHIPFDHPSWGEREGWYAFSDQFMWASGNDPQMIIFMARIVTVYLTIGLAFVGYWTARQFWGILPGFLAFLYLLFDPNILAHGRYATTDLSSTLFFLLATLLIWQLWRVIKPSWLRILKAGIVLGFLLGGKMSMVSGLIFYGLMAVFPPIYGQKWYWRNSLQSLFRLGVATLVALPVVWALYAFEWGHFQFQWATSLLKLNNLQGPMPTYWAGLEQVVALTRGGRPAFLLGQFSGDGFPFYFPVAFLVKTPVIIILLTFVATIILLAIRKTRARAAFLLAPAALYFLMLTQSSLNIGYRHFLPVLPFLYVLIAGLGSAEVVNKFQARWPLVARWLIPALLGCWCLLLLADFIIHPFYLSYFNLLVRPENGDHYLIDSNIDWGQDLMRLQAWQEENQVENIRLGWYGNPPPALYGIEYDPLPGLPHHTDLWHNLPFDPEAPEPGIYAISVNVLWELPTGGGEQFAWFRAREPDDRVGYSIHIYKVP